MRRPVLLLAIAAALLSAPAAASQPDGRAASAADRSPAGAQSLVSRRNPPTIWNSTAKTGHSQINIVEPGRLAFMSGQVALPPDGGATPRDLTAQATLVADNLAKELVELKASPKDIVMFRMYVVNATTDRFTAAWAPIRKRLGGAMPGLTGIGVQSLWTPEVQLEVEMIVRVPDQSPAG